MTVIREMDQYKVDRFLKFLDEEIMKQWDMYQPGRGGYGSAYKFSAEQTQMIRARFLEILDEHDAEDDNSEQKKDGQEDWLDELRNAPGSVHITYAHEKGLEEWLKSLPPGGKFHFIDTRKTDIEDDQ